jgi:VWFA-related protein
MLLLKSRVFFRIFPLILMGALAVPMLGAQQSAPQKPTEPVADPEAGGPAADPGAIALPKRKAAEEAPAPAPAEPKVINPEGMGNITLHVNVPEVTVDVGVLIEKNHQFVPGLKPSNFKVYENGVEQKVIGFKRVEAPVTALMLCEFAANSYAFIYDMKNAAYAFAQQLRPQDYVAMMTFDMRTQIVTDFTQDKRQLLDGINILQIPAFSETNLFDALSESIDRLSRVEGRKYLLVIASGRDTMSRLTFDKILKRVKASRDITIFTVSTGGFVRTINEGRGGMMGAMRDMTYLQADNEMRAFTTATGGLSYFPRFTGEFPDIFRNIDQSIRAKYQLIYRPTNAQQDGSYRKLRVAVVDEEGNPLRIQDEKHKPLKYDILARDGYNARQQVE